MSLCLGTKIYPCPDVPLSWDKARSRKSGTNSSVPGRFRTKPLSQNKTKTGKRPSRTRKGHSKIKKVSSKIEKNILKQEKYILKQENVRRKIEFAHPVLCPGLDFGRKIVIVPSCVASRILTGYPGPSLSKIFSLSRCPFSLAH